LHGARGVVSIGVQSRSGLRVVAVTRARILTFATILSVATKVSDDVRSLLLDGGNTPDG